MKKQAHLKFTYLFWEGHNIIKQLSTLDLTDKSFELFQFKNTNHSNFKNSDFEFLLFQFCENWPLIWTLWIGFKDNFIFEEVKGGQWVQNGGRGVICFQNKLLENQIKKLAWKNVQSNDHSTLHNSQRRKELQFSQTQLSGRSWRNTRYYIFWTSRTFVKPLRTHLLSIFSLKFCHQRALIIDSLLEKSLNVESVENCDHRCYSYLEKNQSKID